MKIGGLPLILCALFLLALSTAGCAQRGNGPTGATAIAGTADGEVMPPYGFIAYCIRNHADCEGGTDHPAAVALTGARWAELNEINDYVNRLPQVDDETRYGTAEYWAVADDKGGDCEDLALRKRKELIDRGWPTDALLLTTAREPDGALHAILTVETDRGELILDNKAWAIVKAEDAPYRFIERQSRERPYVWLSLERPAVAAVKYPPLGSPVPFLVAIGSLKP